MKDYNDTQSGPNREKPVTRVFLVGCPRSGTTLLQSLLIGHSRVLSFPESHFFTKGFGGSRMERLKKKLLAGKHLHTVFDRWLQQVANKGLKPTLLIRKKWSKREMIGQFIAQLDAWARKANKDVWIEKTPMHLDHIQQIARYVPEAKFLHIVRDGRSVVDSLYRVTRQHPGVWGGPRPLTACIEQWNRCLNITLKYHQNPAHYIVCYETLTAQPETTLRHICEFLDIDWQPAMLTSMASSAAAVVLPDETWKEDNLGKEIVPKGLETFRQTFSDTEQHTISAALNMHGYFSLCSPQRESA